MSNVETVKVRNPKDPNGGYMIINKSEFDPKNHEPHDDEAREAVADKMADSEGGVRGVSMIEYDEERRRYEANRGISGGPALVNDGRNPSGTFSEPTPSDIRYPNKDETEFENNHGAFVKKSAAEMREANGMPDAPGGLAPQAPHVGKGPRGKWYVKNGIERTAGPFETEDEAKASLQSDQVDDADQSVVQDSERQAPMAPVAPSMTISGSSDR